MLMGSARAVALLSRLREFAPALVAEPLPPTFVLDALPDLFIILITSNS